MTDSVPVVVWMMMLWGATLLAANVGHFDLAQAGGFLTTQIGIPVGTRAPDGTHDLLDLGIRRSSTKRLAEVMSFLSEQTGVQLPVRREPGTRATAAERARNGSNDADLTLAIDVAEALRNFPGIARRDRLQGPECV